MCSALNSLKSNVWPWSEATVAKTLMSTATRTLWCATHTYYWTSIAYFWMFWTHLAIFLHHYDTFGLFLYISAYNGNICVYFWQHGHISAYFVIIWTHFGIFLHISMMWLHISACLGNIRVDLDIICTQFGYNYA